MLVPVTYTTLPSGRLLGMAFLALIFTVSLPSRAEGALANQTSEPAKQTLPDGELLMRFEVEGGMLLPTATHLPRWSLYDDGLVIWTLDGRSTPGFVRQVWIGYLSEKEILELMSFVDKVGFWELRSDYGPSTQGSTSQKVIDLDPAAQLDQPFSALTVHWKARQKRVTIYPANWQGAPAAYLALRERLLTTRPQTAQELEPHSFRLEVGRVSSIQHQVKDQTWPFPDVDLASAQSGFLTLSREKGLAVGEFLRERPDPAIVLQHGQAFSLRLFAVPPRDP